MLQANGTRVQETERDWVRAHEALSRLARERAAADAEEGRWLLAALRSAAHVHLGFGSFNEYIERMFGYKPRRAALVRDGHCCRVPGCKNSTYLDLHHIELRSEGGRNALENILTVCGAHHRAVHRGWLLIQRDASGRVSFQHGDGTPYGQAPAPRALDVQAKTFSALRGMGFKEVEVRAVLAELRQDHDLRDASLPELLREALRRIRPAHSMSVRG